MRITPLVLHAQRRIPALTSLFADALPVASIAVIAGGTTTLTCSSAHGLALGTSVAVSITDAETPNPITAAIVNADGSVTLTTEFAHDLTTTPDPARADAWNTSAKLDGFGSALIDGTKQLLAAPDRYTLIIQPSGAVGAITLDGGEVLLERLPGELIGYHAATVATTTTLTFATPAAITRDYTVTAPVVVRNMRCFGAATLEAAMRKFVRDDGTAIPANRGWLFVVPIEVRTSRSRQSKTDMLADIGDVTDYRQLLIDGFEVLAVLPAEHSPGGVGPCDKAHGEVLNAVLRTFYGLALPRPELQGAGSYVAILEAHGTARYDGANYMHRYRFQAATYITNADAIAPYDWPDIDPDAITAPLYPVGAPAFREVDLNDGITHQGHPGKLTGIFEIDPTEGP